MKRISVLSSGGSGGTGSFRSEADTVDEFDGTRDMARLPRQAEWEAYVAEMQGCDPSLPSDRKWQMMERIF